MARCGFRWPLLDPNEEDSANGTTHWCRLPPDHGDDVHVCACGEIPEANSSAGSSPDKPRPVRRTMTYGER
jgi:hypothetical protein